MAPSPQLIVTTGPRTGEAYALDDPPLILGRDPRNGMVIDHPEVSRRHACITRTDEGWVVEDLGSTNGTSVNGEPLLRPRLLAWGDTVNLGDAVTLTFRRAKTADDRVRPPAGRRGSSPQPTPRTTTHVEQDWESELRPEGRLPPHSGSAPLEATPRESRTDLAWVWMAAAFLVLLIIAACAAALILSYLGLVPISF